MSGERRPARGRNDALRNALPGLALIAASVLPAAMSPSRAVPAESARPLNERPSAGASATTRGGRPPGIFFGSLHSHTKYSDGSGTPADAFARARDVAGMDFLAVTEHNHDAAERGIGKDDPRKDNVMIATQPALYNGGGADSLLSAARSFTVDDSFVAIAGQEFSTISSGNHANVFEVGEVIDVPNGNYADLYDRWLPQNPDSLGEPPLVQFNHPDYREDLSEKTKESERFNDYGYGSYNRDFGELRRHAEKYVSLIEIVSGPAVPKGPQKDELTIKSGNRHERDYWFYLNEGFRVAPTANQDNHFFNWGTSTRARTAVLADRLTKADLLRALKARRVYATEDPNLQVRFVVNGRQMGDVVFTQQPLDLTFEVEVIDPDEPDAVYKVELYRDEVGGAMIEDKGWAERSELEGDGRVVFANQRFESGRVFYFVKVRQEGSDGREEFVWTAPVWIETGIAPTPTPRPSTTPSPTPQATARFVHSRNSEIYHLPDCADVALIKPENRIESGEEPEDKTLHEGCPRRRR